MAENLNRAEQQRLKLTPGKPQERTDKALGHKKFSQVIVEEGDKAAASQRRTKALLEEQTRREQLRVEEEKSEIARASALRGRRNPLIRTSLLR